MCCDVSGKMEHSTDPETGEAQLVWVYEPDERPKKKHRWGNADAGFVDVGGVPVGKCPSDMTLLEAQDLLQSGIPWSPRGWRHSYPKRLYAVYRGVLYRATPTNPGRSYHGFPEHPSHFPTGSRALKDEILKRARADGCEAEVREWMNW